MTVDDKRTASNKKKVISAKLVDKKLKVPPTSQNGHHLPHKMEMAHIEYMEIVLTSF